MQRMTYNALRTLRSLISRIRRAQKHTDGPNATSITGKTPTKQQIKVETDGTEPNESSAPIKIEIEIQAKPQIKDKWDCPLCDMKLTSRNTKDTHLRNEHQMQEIGRGLTKQLVPTSKYICDYCQKEFSSRHCIWIHISRAHDMPTKCPECGEQVTYKTLLRHRADVHGAQIPTCGICGYQNKEEGRVEMHQRQVHLREKNVACPHCDKCFFSNQFLRRHIVKHTGQKNYECRFCHKKFLRMATRYTHEKIHKGEKNKICTQCGAGFVQKAALNYHMTKYHPEVPF